MLCHDVFVNICYRCANICCVRTMNICYVMFMLTVFWAMNIYGMLTCYMYYRVPFYTRTAFRQKTNITGYQALDPTANKYLSGSGWEISICCYVCLCFCCSVFFELFCCCYVLVCVFSIVNAKA